MEYTTLCFEDMPLDILYQLESFCKGEPIFVYHLCNYSHPIFAAVKPDEVPFLFSKKELTAKEIIDLIDQDFK